jgi:hypothetical protein
MKAAFCLLTYLLGISSSTNSLRTSTSSAAHLFLSGEKRRHNDIVAKHRAMSLVLSRDWDFESLKLPILFINLNIHSAKVVSSGTIVDLAISGAKSYFGNVVYFDSDLFIHIREFQTGLNVKRTS